MQGGGFSVCLKQAKDSVCRSGRRLTQAAAVFICAETGQLFEGTGKMAAVGIADEINDVADFKARVCQQFLGLFDADGIEQVVIALLFYCIFRIRVRGSINFPNRQCCQFKAVNLMQNSLKFKLARQDAPNHRKSSANSYALACLIVGADAHISPLPAFCQKSSVVSSAPR